MKLSHTSNKHCATYISFQNRPSSVSDKIKPFKIEKSYNIHYQKFKEGNFNCDYLNIKSLK